VDQETAVESREIQGILNALNAEEQVISKGIAERTVDPDQDQTLTKEAGPEATPPRETMAHQETIVVVRSQDLGLDQCLVGEGETMMIEENNILTSN